MVKNILAKLKSLLLILLSIALILTTFIVTQHYRKKSIASRAVNDMYTFIDYAILCKNNMRDLQKICTPEVYKALSVTNADRALFTYLKFKNQPVEVKIEKATSQYIIYTLDTPSITPTRKFIFFYTINIFGKIDSVQEDELYDFYQNID